MINLNTAPNESIVNELNNHGKRLLEICKNTDLGILNGKLCGDSIGGPTFHSILDVSVIDYAISDQDLLRHIANFIVKEQSSYSDHRPVVTWLNINTMKQNPVIQLLTIHFLHLSKHYIWENLLHYITLHYKRKIYRECF